MSGRLGYEDVGHLGASTLFPFSKRNSGVQAIKITLVMALSRPTLIFTVVVAQWLATFASSAMLEATKVFITEGCKGKPYIMTMRENASCIPDVCRQTSFDNSTYYTATACNVSDRYSQVEEVFDTSDYIFLENYNDSDCDSGSFVGADTYLAAGTCVIASINGGISVIASISSNGSANLTFYNGGNCAGDPADHFELDNWDSSDSSDSSSTLALSIGACEHYHGYPVPSYKFYKSWSVISVTLVESYSDSDATTGTIGLHVVGAVGLVVGNAGLIIWVIQLVWRRWTRPPSSGSVESIAVLGPQRPSSSSCVDGGYVSPTAEPNATSFLHITNASELQGEAAEPRSLYGLWEDEIIVTARIPREKITVHRLISRGGYGEVYSGSFNGLQVAVKTLLSEKRKSVKQVNAFLAEVKLMATLEHPRIVQFVGVAWDSLTDLCAVCEYMEGGDLRALLASYEAQSHPVGFDRSKITIALHVAHALTYLHSLERPVLHRDLKSRNILLTASLEAKLTDFGVSREHVDRTMTAGVGTSLWMAPEVMLGERYDDKADVFSFGVVLSELDLHTLPYAHAKEKGDSGRQVPGTAVLQMVALGELQVEFSPQCLESVAALGRACVSVDPTNRPTAAKALHILHTGLTREV
ncbi:hypothetical protein BBJ28_00011580 [Nothophytophthora sp. Chile5]|nr:hypothetical protein BBJ28_00011580 [Nothophytophthora sp. Chile5]